jgi:hypothetical protein
MVSAFGHQYVAYRQRTGMFLPRLAAGRPAGGVSPAR